MQACCHRSVMSLIRRFAEGQRDRNELSHVKHLIMCWVVLALARWLQRVCRKCGRLIQYQSE